MEVIKSIEINGANYQVAKMDADTGSWLLMLLLGRLMKVMREAAAGSTDSNNVPEVKEQTEEQKKKEQEEFARASITMILTDLDQDMYSKVQKAALKCCYKLEGKDILLPVPIMQNGRFTIKELQYDIEVVTKLTSEAIVLNVAPFFTAEKLLNL